VLWWTLAALGVIGVIVLLVFLFRKKSPKEQVNEVINKAKAQIQKAEIDEKIKVAEARGEEKAVVDRLKEIKKLDDAHEQAKELEKLL
jgi:nucleotide-binding universal stress UspA family protein